MLPSNEACSSYILKFKFSGSHFHDQPAMWLPFTMRKEQYEVDELTFGQQIFFRGDGIYFQKLFLMHLQWIVKQLSNKWGSNWFTNYEEMDAFADQ